MQLKPHIFFIFFLSLVIANGLGRAPRSVFANVSLVSFTATPSDRQIDLRWETASEIGTNGFYIQRSQQDNDSDYARISDFIPVSGDGFTGSVYPFSDTGLTNGITYYYKLEVINSNQKIESYGPVSATVGVSVSTSTPTQTHTATTSLTLTRAPTTSPTATITTTPTYTFTPAPTATRPPEVLIPTATRTATFSNFATVVRTATAQSGALPSASPGVTRPAMTATATLTATISATVTATTLPATASAMPLIPTNTISATPLVTPQPQSEEPSSTTLILGGIAVAFVMGLGGWTAFGSLRGGRLK